MKHKKQGWSVWLIRLFVCLLAGVLSVELFTPPVQQDVAHPEEMRATSSKPLQTNEQLFTIVRSVLFHTSRPVQHFNCVSSLSDALPTFVSPTLRYNRNSTVGRGDTNSRIWNHSAPTTLPLNAVDLLMLIKDFHPVNGIPTQQPGQNTTYVRRCIPIGVQQAS